MAELPRPMEILDLEDGASLTTRILRGERGEATIKTRDAPEGKRIEVLRIHVPPADKAHFPYYWDITGAGLQAQLGAFLTRGDLPVLTFKMTARGIQPKKRYELQVTPGGS